MSKPRFICKDCRYVWRTKKDDGRPANCPRCNSKLIMFDILTSNQVGMSIGIVGLLMFIFSFKDTSSTAPMFRTLGFFGTIVLFLVIIVMIQQHKKNKIILKKFSN